MTTAAEQLALDLHYYGLVIESAVRNQEGQESENYAGIRRLLKTAKELAVDIET